MLVAIHLLVFVGPLAWTVPPQQTSALEALLPPGAGHPLGTDDLGRDELSRLLHGGQVTLLVGFAAMLTATAARPAGRRHRRVLSRLAGHAADALDRHDDRARVLPDRDRCRRARSGPGDPDCRDRRHVVDAGGARHLRRDAALQSLQDFVLAAEAMGARRAAILFRHVLPQTIPSVVVSATLGVGFAILTEAAVSYLGLGIQPPTPSWGNMLQNAQQYVWTSPALAIFPGAVITAGRPGVQLPGRWSARRGRPALARMTPFSIAAVGDVAPAAPARQRPVSQRLG